MAGKIFGLLTYSNYMAIIWQLYSNYIAIAPKSQATLELLAPVSYNLILIAFSSLSIGWKWCYS